MPIQYLESQIGIAAHPSRRPLRDLLRMRSNSLKHNNLMLRSERRERLEAWAASDSPISHNQYLWTGPCFFVICKIGIGGSLTTPPLPHHRTYGSVYGGSRSYAHAHPSATGETPRALTGAARR